MNPVLGAVLLVVVFLVALLAGVTSERARRSTLPFLIGTAGGLFSVQLVNVHLFTPLVVAWFLARAGRGEARLSWGAVALPLVCAPVALTVFTGDLVVNPLLSVQLMALAGSGALLVAGRGQDVQRPVLLGLMAATTAAAIFGLLQVAHVVPTDLWHVEVSALGRPTGFYPEPDWLGMYAGVGAMIAWRVQLPPKVRTALVLLNLSALVLAFARAAWLGFALAAAVGLLVFLLQPRRDQGAFGTGKTGRLRAVLLTAAALATAITVIPDLRADLLNRLGSTLVAHSTDVSAQARVQQNRTLGALADSAPWFGHGLSASGRVGVSGIFYSQESLNSVASNWVLGLWVDAAWLSVPLIMLVLVVTVRTSARVEGSVIIVVATSSFFSNATFQPVFWLALALAICCTRDARPRRDRRATSHEASAESGQLEQSALVDGQRGAPTTSV